MRFAVLCPEFPYPAVTGGRLLLFNRIEHLRRVGNEVYLFITCKEPVDEADLKYLRSRYTGVTLYERWTKKKSDAAVSLLTGKPFEVQNRYFQTMNDDVLSVRPDCIFVEMPQMLLNLSPLTCRDVPVVVSQQNVEWKTLQSLAETYPSLSAKRLAYHFEAKTMGFYERHLYSKRTPRAITFVAEQDLNQFEFAGDVPKILAAPGAADYHSELHEHGRTLLFVGNYAYRPNLVGAEWLIDEVMPRVFEKMPGARLLLVGKDPSSTMLLAAQRDSRIVVTGRVEHLDAYYESADVVVLPIFDGGGIKMKALEAASSGRPIVSTSFALLNTGLEDGVHALCADSAVDFASHVVSCIEHPDHYEDMIQKCYRHYQSHLSWDASNEAWYESVAEEVFPL